MKSVGIDAVSFYVPQLYVSIKELAEKRAIPYDKLNKGLGLEKMAIPDINEDAASFAANALLKLFTDYNIDPHTIGRIYLGTESAVDGSKPTATYAVEYLEQYLEPKFGSRCFKNCDIVDLTFACIGGVDAMHNCLDWIKAGQNRKAIVIASDLSKYELQSTGEYTQGAGAVALLLSENPSIIKINDTVGIGAKSVGDFFKPRKKIQKSSVVKEINNLSENASLTGIEFLTDQKNIITLYKEEPVFDGQYSNQCYSDRITEALEHYKTQKEINFQEDWNHFVFHLPYAYHGRRIILNNWLEWIKNTPLFNALVLEVGTPEEDQKTWIKRVANSSFYNEFVQNKIAPSEKASSIIGNMYTASIFMALLSLLSDAYQENKNITHQKIGFIAYGSGSKSKVFEGVIQPQWKEKISALQLIETLNNRKKISLQVYEDLHNEVEIPRQDNTKKIILQSVEQTNPNALGLRNYNYL